MYVRTNDSRIPEFQNSNPGIPKMVNFLKKKNPFTFQFCSGSFFSPFRSFLVVVVLLDDLFFFVLVVIILKY